MMKSSRLKEYENIEKNIIKYVRNLFRLKKTKKRIKKETNEVTVKDIRNLFRLTKENKAIKERIIRDIKKIFEHEEGDYYKPVRVVIFGVTVIFNIKLKVIEKHYQLKNILIKLDKT